jgi:hypothetical protein
VEPTAADFFEGQVLEVNAGKLKVQAVEGGESVLIGMADAYRIPSQNPTLSVSAWAICQTVPHRWFACRITGSKSSAATLDAGVPEAGAEVTAVDAYGTEHVFPGDRHLIAPTSLSAMNIERRFDQLTKRVSFEKSLREAGEPRRQPGWQPAPRRMVLARRQGQWFGAQIVEIDDGRIVVRWDGEKGTTDLSQDEVAPQPPACGTATRGDRALRRPAGHGAAWIPVAVVSVDGTDASVEDIERNRVTLQLRDLCPLGKTVASANSR